jgi:hypothetical protein
LVVVNRLASTFGVIVASVAAPNPPASRAKALVSGQINSFRISDKAIKGRALLERAGMDEGWMPTDNFS